MQGAGDAFVGALAFFMARNQFAQFDMKEKLRRACEIATLSVLKKGTQTSYPWKEELDPELLL